MRLVITLIKRILKREPERNTKAIWCLVANVRQMHLCDRRFEKRRSAKHFPPGAKVYCFVPLRGDGYENIKIVGRHRASHRYATMVVSSKRLTNWRTQLVYNSHVVRVMAGRWDDGSNLLAERLAAEMRRRELRRC